MSLILCVSNPQSLRQSQWRIQGGPRGILCVSNPQSLRQSQWRIQGGAQGAWAPPFSQQTRSRMVTAWLHAMLCVLARARVSAFYNAGSCTRAMKKRDIRTLTSVTKQGRRNRSRRSDQSLTTLQRSSNQYS